MPQPLAPILPTSPEVSIVTSARPFPVSDLADAFSGGLSFRDDFCLPVEGWPRCPDGELEKVDPSEPDFPEFKPWTIYVPVVCSGKVNAEELFNSARKSLDAKRPYAVAKELWTGEWSGSDSLQSTAVDIGGGSAVPPHTAVQVLIQAFQEATGGSKAFVHVPQMMMSDLYVNMTCTRVGDRLLTPTGDVIIPGPGYPVGPGDSGPAGSDPIDPAQAWIYVTGPVELAFGEITDDMTSGTMPAGTFARLNKYTLYVEQDAIFRFPTCSVFAMLSEITLSSGS